MIGAWDNFQVDGVREEFMQILRNAMLCTAFVVGICLFARAGEISEIEYGELWRTEAGDDAPYLFGTPGRVRADSLGRVYVLDTQLRELHSFEASGAYRGRLIGQGEGPGELSRCYDFDIWPGECLAIPQGREVVTVFDLDGIYIHSLVIGNSDPIPLSHVSVATRIADRILVRGTRFNEHAGAEEDVLGLYSADGILYRAIFAKLRIRQDYTRPIVHFRELDLFFKGSRFALGTDGLVYVASSRDEFLIEIFDLQGRRAGEISAEWPKHARSPGEIESTKQQHVVTASPGVKLPEITYEIESTAPTIRRLLWIEGALWVEVDAERASDELVGRFAIVDSSGSIKEVRDVLIPGVKRADRVEFLSDGRIVVAKNYASAARSRSAGANMKVGGSELSSLDRGDEEGVFLIVFGAAR